MKKLLAFILSFAIAFSAVGIVPAFAAGGVSTEARALETLEMLIGDGSGVTYEYTQKEMTRFTAAISILKLRGLYDDALEYKGYDNFVDEDQVKWAEGKNILAYLKSNSYLGFIGDDKGRFNPYKNINEQAYYKVLLETLGYKQKVTGVKGDFAWEDTLKFAASVGLKPSKESKFTIDLLAKATVAALKTSTKEDKKYINVLIDSGKVKKSRALAAGLIRDIIDKEAKSVKAIGNTAVEVVFEERIDKYDGENLDNYAIDGLTVKSVVLVREDAVRLVTSTQTSGKLYALKVGDSKLKFTGVAKVSGAPRIKSVKSEDVETVVIEFDKELDFISAANPSNYSISGVDIDEADLEGKKVTLTTYGLAGRKQYTVKASNIKSVDGTVLRSESKSFYTRLDTNPPTLKDVKAETNQRVVVKFSEAVTRYSAEDLRNYYIKSSSGELEIWEAKLTGDDEDTVELTTEPQKSGTKYEITAENIVDKTKAANAMKRPAKKTFYGMRVDTAAPQFVKSDLKVLSRNHIQVVISDSSRIDEDTALDPSNYEVVRNDRYKESMYVEGVEKVSYIEGKYKVMLEVEDLAINSSYTVTAYNIEDEFGNVLEKNNSGTVTAARDDFASATVKDYKVLGGNKLEIYFTKPLDEESAEDISNYYINNDIGTPMEAVYKDEKVTLETAAMLEGKVYKMTIDGARDMTGNNLKLSFEFRAIAGESDLQGPKLDYIYALNKYVVAAVFDEPVIYTPDVTTLELGRGIKLYAKAIANDDNTIEFSNVAGNMALSDYVVYTIDKDKSFKGIYDRTVNKNPFDRDSLQGYDLEVYGNGEKPEAPEILYITQRDGKSFGMEMSKEVVVIDGSIDTIGASSATFDVKVEGDAKDFAAFTITSARYIDGNKDYKIDISKILTDKHGIKAENTHDSYTMLYGEYKDEDKPYIENVTALDRITVEIEYSEAIGYEGKYTIKNLDDYARYRTISNSLKKIDKNKVILSLGQPLEERYEYALIIEIQAKDLVQNVSEDRKGDEFYFMGTDLAPVKVPEIEDQAAADLVISKIAALPKDIKLTDKEAVNDAAAKYNALTAKQKQLVTNYSVLAAAQEKISSLEAEEKKIADDKTKAAAVVNMIDELPKLGDLKLGDKAYVEAAKKAYEALTSSQKGYVSNYLKLKAAELNIAELEERKAAEEEKQKQEEEQKRIEEEQRRQEEERKRIEEEQKQQEDLRKASEVIKKINEIPEAYDLNLKDKAAVKAARDAYNALTNDQRANVTNYQKLQTAEAKMLELEEAARKEEEQRKAEEEARRQAEAAALEAVVAFETAAGEEVLGAKVTTLSTSVETLKTDLASYLQPIIIPDRTTDENELTPEQKAKLEAAKLAEKKAGLDASLTAATAAAKNADEQILAAWALETPARDAAGKLEDSDIKISLEARIAAAKGKIESAATAAGNLKGEIATVKDTIDVEDAKAYLTVDKFKFGTNNPADSESPRIAALLPYANGAKYEYTEFGKIVDGKYVKNTAPRVENAAYIEIVASDGNAIVYRGAEDASIILKVLITKGNVKSEKLIKVNIPSLSSKIGDKYSVVTIEAVTM